MHGIHVIYVAHVSHIRTGVSPGTMLLDVIIFAEQHGLRETERDASGCMRRHHASALAPVTNMWVDRAPGLDARARREHCGVAVRRIASPREDAPGDISRGAQIQAAESGRRAGRRRHDEPSMRAQRRR